jgi:thiamine biosynthesis lipoprotein ApbE
MIASFPALGTTATVAATGDRAALAAARVAVERGLDAIDRACSRFRADSELARLNGARGRPVAVGSLLLEAVQIAVAAARTTGGIVDPTIGRTLRLAGYDSTFTVVAARDGRAFRARFAPTAGWETIEIDAERGTITVPAGVELDLGATAKALAADRAARAACVAAGCGVLVALGGDIAVSGDPPLGGWAVGIADDHAAPPETVHTTVAVESGGLATSSTTVRRWRSGESDLHHVIDPRTGRPAVGPWRTVSVAATSCLDANVASTAALVLGTDAISWLEQQGLPSRLVSTHGDVAVVRGWPTEEIAA